MTERWRIGELAAATGLTVRTLHHYEQIGLLAASSRTEGRQRRYDERDVRRLYRICALRDLGLKLSDIGRMLGEGRGGLVEVLRAHRARVEAELQRLERLRTLLDHACAGREVDAGAMLATLEAMSRVARRGDARRAAGKARGYSEARWRKLGQALRACMKAGLAPSAPRAQAVARQVLAGIVAFSGGDRATLDALAHLRRRAPPRNLAGWTPPMMRYLDEALTALGPRERKR